MLLSGDVSLAEGVLAMAALVLLQYLVSRASLRWQRVEQLVKSEPVLLYRSGFLSAPMRRARVTEDEVRQAARASGHADLDDVVAVVLETDGSFSVLSAPPEPPFDGS